MQSGELAGHKRAAVDAMREYAAETDDRLRARHLQAAAVELAGARRYFTTNDGRPDYAGRSYLYRRFAGDVLSEAGVPDGERHRVFSALRWHVGKIIREIAPLDDLRALGLADDSPEVRARRARAEKAVTYHALLGASPDALSTSDPLTALEASLALLESITTPALAAAGAPERVAEVVKASRRNLTRLSKAAGEAEK